MDYELILLNRILVGNTLTGEEALLLLHWLLFPDDETEVVEDEN